MKETLRLHKFIANRPFPPMCLWSASSLTLMKHLELAEPASLPLKTDYQTFVIPSQPSETPPAERTEEEPEDNIELCNKLSILNTLEARMQALDDQSPCDAATPPPSSPVMIEGSSQESAGPTHDSSGNVVHSVDKLLTQYWKENPRPISLPPIGTIIDTIDNPDSTTELQKPMRIWQEFVRLETQPNLGDVHHSQPI